MQSAGRPRMTFFNLYLIFAALFCVLSSLVTVADLKPKSAAPSDLT